MTTLLRVRDLTAGYQNVPVVRGLDLHVDAGEVVVLLGPNGAGKSTTLLTVAGELAVIGGTIELFGAPATGRLNRRARAGLAYLPEGRAVFGSMSVDENLRIGLGTVDDALTFGAELGALRHRRGGLLSGGEQQILALARALAARPRLIVADELSLGLAPLVVKRMLAAVRAAADAGAGVLLVEQHAHQALAVADRGYVLRRGEIVLDGKAETLAADIGNSYLAGSIDNVGAATP